MAQLQEEMETEKREREAIRDAEFYTALAKDPTLTRARFEARKTPGTNCHCEGSKNPKQPHGTTQTTPPRVAGHPSIKEGNFSLRQRYIQKLVAECEFKSAAPSSFKNVKSPTPEHGKVYKLLDAYCSKFPGVNPANIVLCGATGTGKTFAAHVAANCLLERGFSVLYTTSFGLVERFKNYIKNYGDETETDALFECDMLVIDDLGTEPVIRNITQEYLYSVINERLVNGRAIVITTNLSPRAIIEKYDQRIASRILSKHNSTVIELGGKDLRMQG